AAVAFPAMSTIARDRGDDAGARVDAADDVVLGLDDQQIPAGIDGELLGRVERRGERVAAVSVIAARAGAGDGADVAGTRIDGAQRAALAFEDVDGAIRCHLHGTRAED